MQTIIYNKKTKKISMVITNGKIKGNKVFGDNGSCIIGDGGNIITVPNNTVQVDFDGRMERFIPEVISDKWQTVELPKTLEDRVADLEQKVAVITKKLKAVGTKSR